MRDTIKLLDKAIKAETCVTSFLVKASLHLASENILFLFEGAFYVNARDRVFIQARIKKCQVGLINNNFAFTTEHGRQSSDFAKKSLPGSNWGAMRVSK